MKPPAYATEAALALAALTVLGAVRITHSQPRALGVCVLDFENDTHRGGDLLGRVAAAQVALQLDGSSDWDVVPEASVQKRIQELRLHAPFDQIDRARLASKLGAAAVAYGTITEARVKGENEREAYVRLRLLVEDAHTGELIAGADADGRTPPRTGAGNDDQLLEEALGKAAFRARQFMDGYRLPEGTVLNATEVFGPPTRRVEVTLNLGSRQGIKRGTKLLVTRRGESVGRLWVTSTGQDTSTAIVLENYRGVRPEDHVRAVFELGDLSRRKDDR